MGSSIVTSGSKGDFDWWTECFLYEYRIACEVSFNIEPWKVYTLQELSELCKQRKVVVLDRRAGRGRGWVSSGEKTEADAQIKLNDFGSKEEMDALAFKVLRADITKKDVEKDYKKLCNAYENLCSRVKKKIEEAKKKIEDSQKELNYFTDVVKKTIEEKNDEMCK